MACCWRSPRSSPAGRFRPGRGARPADLHPGRGKRSARPGRGGAERHGPAAAHPTDELRDLTAALALHAPPGARPPRTTAGGRGNEPFGAEWPGARTRYPRERQLHRPLARSPVLRAQPGLRRAGPDGPLGQPGARLHRPGADAAEESFDVENGALGWPAPSRTAAGAATRIDVYVADICDETNGACIFGYANTDDPSDQCRSRRSAASRTWSSTTTTTSASSATTTRACRSA